MGGQAGRQAGRQMGRQAGGQAEGSRPIGRRRATPGQPALEPPVRGASGPLFGSAPAAHARPSMAAEMMAAIAAARKAEAGGEQGGPGGPSAAGGSPTAAFEEGDRVQYWTSKGKWVVATVLDKREKDGLTVYDLDRKMGVEAAKLRMPQKEGKSSPLPDGSAKRGVSVATYSA